MKLDIRRITYKNIREMKDLTINLEESDKIKHISVIQMPNGIGKTTTMELIRYCLDNNAENVRPEIVKSFKPPKSDFLNGEFQLLVSIDNQIMNIKLLLDYENGHILYRTNNPKKGGEIDGLDLGDAIAPWLRSNFVRLFIFDGELAGELLEADNTSAENAIRALYHLDNLKAIYEDDGTIDKIINQRMLSNIKTEQGKKNIETKLRNAREKKNHIEQEISSLKSSIDSINSQMKAAIKKRNDYRAEDARFIEKYQELISTNQLLEEQIKELSEKLLEAMRSPHNLSTVFSDNLRNLGDQMGKLKLPKTQSMEFFIELSESIECVCGRPIGETEKQIILENSKNYLSEDNIGIINIIKTHIRNLSEKVDLEEEYINKIKEKNRNIRTNERRISILDRKTKNKEKIDELTQKIADLTSSKQDTTELLKLYTTNKKEEQELYKLGWEDNLNLCESYIAGLESQIAMTEQDFILRSKSKKLKKILSEIDSKSMEKLKTNILLNTNDKIKKILKRNEINISRIGSHLVLDDREGVSEGQKLSIAYAFLSTLFSQSPHELPFVVDTPAAPLDLAVRREVAETLPQLFKQIIVFITSSERDGFANQFYTYDNCNFITIRKEGINLLQDNSLEFFKNFQSEE